MRVPKPAPADWLTLSRLVSVPFLWVLALNAPTMWLGIGVGLAGLTDVLDGPVARYTGRSSPLGGQLDSTADILLMGSIFWWFVILSPEFFLDNATPLLVWAVVGTVSVVATYVKFGRFGNLHLYSAKTAGVVGYLFVVWYFTFGDYSPAFFTFTAVLAVLAASETLLVALTRREAGDGVGSIFIRPR